MRTSISSVAIALLFTTLAAGEQTRPTGDPPQFRAWPFERVEPSAQRADDLRRRVERIAADLPYFGIEFTYDRPPRIVPDHQAMADVWRSLREPEGVKHVTRDTGFGMHQGPWAAEEILPLLKHDDAKVRSLGIALLFQLNRADVLHHLVPLLADDARTFDTPAQLSNRLGRDVEWPMQPTTVADYARAALNAWAFATEGLTIRQGDEAHPAALTQTVQKWGKTIDPATSVVWWKIAMQRASRGTSPIPNDRQLRVDGLLSQTHRLDPTMRFFVLRAAEFDQRADPHRWATNVELNAARRVPLDTRVAVVLGRDVPEARDVPKWRLLPFFHHHAVDLFPARTADDFVERAAQLEAEGDHDGAADLIAMAARLQPEHADKWLLEAIERVPPEDDYSENRAREVLANAIAQAGSPKAWPWALDWFFDMKPRPGAYGFGREKFLRQLHAYSPARARRIHELIIRDPRLEQIGPASTRELVQAVAGYLGRPIATPQEIEDSHGIDEAQRDEELAALPEWHQRLRATVDEWSTAERSIPSPP